jgi:hypothetical protein
LKIFGVILPKPGPLIRQISISTGWGSCLTGLCKRRFWRARTEFFPPVRIQIHQSHLVIYTVEADHILIVRVVGGKQNWLDILHKTEL